MMYVGFSSVERRCWSLGDVDYTFTEWQEFMKSNYPDFTVSHIVDKTEEVWSKAVTYQCDQEVTPFFRCW